MLFIKSGRCQTHEDAKRLYNVLFRNHTKHLKPGRPNDQLVLNTFFSLSSINSVREVDEVIQLTGAIYVKWKDESLTWNPALYGNQYTIQVRTDNVWLPPLYIINRVDDMKSLGSDKLWFVTIESDGTVHYSPGEVFDAKCSTDISKFPFDTQTCILDMITWGYTSQFMAFNSTAAEANLVYYSPNSDWKLLKYSTYSGPYNHYTKFSIDVSIKRASLYYTVMVVLPTVLFALLNPLVFVLPVDAGERIGLAMTVLLSYAIFLTLVSASIPASSNPMSILLIVMVMIISVSGVIAFVTIFSVGIYHADDTENIPRFLVILTRWNFRRKRNAVVPLCDEKIYITGKKVAIVLDKISLIASYSIIIIVIFSYLIFVTV